MTRSLTLISCALAFTFASCNGGGEQAANNKAISMTAVGSSPDFPNAQLSIDSVTAVKMDTDSVKIAFYFGVKNYELKMQTADNGNKQCSNSDKGQHIHFIMDEQPYKALYEPKNEITLPKNSEHYLMAFLSRSYHESLKNKGAAVVYHFKIDSAGNMKKLDDPTMPMIFYSRPKGDYIGKDTANVLFDFYVWNCTLSKDGYKVNAKISNTDQGKDTSITITDWKAYFLHNLGQGKSNISLTLVDKDGKQVDAPNTMVNRSFTLAADEPLKK